ncbi:Cytoplasmic Dynein 2 Light Intermediate Chain 1 [Manis pentadactyla]|nr:Cytoplasmic Dynein 2 Light Intermediate Chain 1 [Manis pentadactyla]
MPGIKDEESVRNFMNLLHAAVIVKMMMILFSIPFHKSPSALEDNTDNRLSSFNRRLLTTEVHLQNKGRFVLSLVFCSKKNFSRGFLLKGPRCPKLKDHFYQIGKYLIGTPALSTEKHMRMSSVCVNGDKVDTRRAALYLDLSVPICTIEELFQMTSKASASCGSLTLHRKHGCIHKVLFLLLVNAKSPSARSEQEKILHPSDTRKCPGTMLAPEPPKVKHDTAVIRRSSRISTGREKTNILVPLPKFNLKPACG